jgi:hypothetical protein
MAYYLVRFYSGSGDRPPEQLIREVVDHELRPKLQEGGGLTRYITFIADDGRIGSASVYEDGSPAKTVGGSGLYRVRSAVAVDCNDDVAGIGW